MKKSLLFIGGFVLLSIFACTPNCDNVPKFFEVKGIAVAGKKIVQTYTDGSYKVEEYDSTEAIDYHQFLLEITPEADYFSQNNTLRLSDVLFTPVYAGKCPAPGYKGSPNQIASIHVFSNQVFLENGAVSDTLTEFFTVEEEGLYATSLYAYTSTLPYATKSLRLGLNHKPMSNKKHQFTVVYQLVSGEEFEATTAEILFK